MIAPHRPSRPIVPVLIAGLMYFVLASATVAIEGFGTQLTSVWPANAVVLALLLSTDRPRWRLSLAAGVIALLGANEIVHGKLSGAILYGVFNMLEVAIAAVALRRVLPDGEMLANPARIGQFALWAGLIAPAIGAVGGGAAAWATYGYSFWSAVTTWFLGDALGLLIFTPFLLALFRGEYIAAFRRNGWPERLEAAGLQVLTGVMAAGVFGVSTLPLLFCLHAPVMLATFRSGALGAQTAVMVIAVIGAVATIAGQGPVAAAIAYPAAQAHLLQFFLAFMLLTCLPVAGGLSARGALMARLSASEERLREREADLYRRATTDALTGILNRSAFTDTVEEALLVAPGTIRLAVIDLDLFKQVNDRYGHQAGDDALVHVAAILCRHIRPGDVVGRLGGDEFMVMFRTADDGEVEAICRAMAAAVRATPLMAGGDGPPLTTTFSCGLARDTGGARFDDLVRRADQALYAAKRGGGGRVAIAASS